MFQKVIQFLLIILLTELKISKESTLTNSEPDFENQLIEEKWRQWCGLRFIPKVISFSKNCFINPINDSVFPNHFAYNRKIRMTSTRVLGGKNVRKHESPWTVQITKKEYGSLGSYDYDSHGCTGVFLTMRHILTAAHCYDDEISMRIYAGSDETAKGWNSDKYTFYRHENYTPIVFHPDGTKIYKHENDIGMIVLTKPVDWERWGYHKRRPDLLINTICLPQKEDFYDPKFEGNPYRNATVYGWGKIRDQHITGRLQRGDVSVQYESGFGINPMLFKFKAGGRESRLCSGDSGGGLVQYLDEMETRAVLIGINIGTWKRSETTNLPCSFDYLGISKSIRVTKYLNWINEKLSL